MANQPSPTVEEIQLRKRARRRLVGAVTVVALMVTVLPMILDDEPKPVGQDIAINIPSQDKTDFPTAAPSAPPAAPSIPVSPPPQAVATPPEANMTAPAVPEKHLAPPKPAETKKPVEAKKPAETKKPAEAKPAATSARKPDATAEKPKETKPAPVKNAEAPPPGNSFIILLGSFLSEGNATQRQAKLKEAGVKFYVEKIKSPTGEKIAVRAGPYPDRQEAERVLAKLKAAGIQDGMVKEK